MAHALTPLTSALPQLSAEAFDQLVAVAARQLQHAVAEDDAERAGGLLSAAGVAEPAALQRSLRRLMKDMGSMLESGQYKGNGKFVKRLAPLGFSEEHVASLMKHLRRILASYASEEAAAQEAEPEPNDAMSELDDAMAQLAGEATAQTAIATELSAQADLESLPVTEHGTEEPEERTYVMRLKPQPPAPEPAAAPAAPSSEAPETWSVRYETSEKKQWSGELTVTSEGAMRMEPLAAEGGLLSMFGSAAADLPGHTLQPLAGMRCARPKSKRWWLGEFQIRLDFAEDAILLASGPGPRYGKLIVAFDTADDALRCTRRLGREKANVRP